MSTSLGDQLLIKILKFIQSTKYHQQKYNNKENTLDSCFKWLAVVEGYGETFSNFISVIYKWNFNFTTGKTRAGIQRT